MVGIELSSLRAEQARLALAKFKAQDLLQKNRKLLFIENDILKEKVKDATAIFICNTVFPKPLMKKITEKLATLRSGLKVVVMKRLPKCCGGENFEMVQRFSFQTSWSRSGSPAYLYLLKKPGIKSKTPKPETAIKSHFRER